MAQIVAGFGVPHTPIFPFLVKRDGPHCETAKLFEAQREQLAAARPDIIVMFDTDHLNTFFLDNLPIFAIGVDASFKGPNDEPHEVPDYVVPSTPELAAHIRNAPTCACRSFPSSSADTCRRCRPHSAVTPWGRRSLEPSRRGHRHSAWR